MTLLFLAPIGASGQDTLQDELDALNAELDSIFANEADSASLFSLIDELLKPQPRQSEVQFRIGYSSRVTSAGRDFGLDQQGLTPGISLYHHSGIYVDASGFWNSELDPKYNLTVMTLGYLGRIKNKTTFGLSYDHSFFTDKDESQTLTNSLSGSLTQDFKFLYSGLDYSYSFGSESAHRVIWNITGNLSMTGFGPIKRITFLPSFAILFGNQNITTQYTRTSHVTRFQNTSDREMLLFSNRLQNAGFENTTARFLIRLRDALNNDEPLTDIQSTAYELLFLTSDSENNFSLMNYSISVPVMFETKSVNFFMSYNYNIPQNQEGAEYVFESNGYFGFTATYNLPIKSR
ncbi:MAG: hypothetical protein ABJF11_14665 [Reichenbachiella sp.]|uniref:hypothetical protein n=1 Tax=Reichenbachiella sp. TaxID=2184521 RepID=UPI0032652C50